MRILWMTPFLPAPDAGHAGGRASYQWLTGIARWHDVTLACRVEPGERQHLERLRPHVRAVSVLEFHRPPPGPLLRLRIAASYLALGRLGSRLLRDGGFDVVHVEYIETGLGVTRRRTTPGLMVAHDEIVKPARRRLALAAGVPAKAGAFLAWRAAIAVQRRVCRKFQRVLALSACDARALAADHRGLSVGVLPFPLGIDPDRVPAVEREPGRLLFVGAMGREVNVEAMTYFCRDVWPLVRRQTPEARLTIVGDATGDGVRRLAAEPGVELTGFVPAVEPYYARATAFVAPLRVGGGIIAKNLDAMAAGCPVVTTSIGNEGIEATPGEHLLTADHPEAFARAVVAVLQDPGLRGRLADNARAFVRGRFSLAASLAALERELTALAATRR